MRSINLNGSAAEKTAEMGLEVSAQEELEDQVRGRSRITKQEHELLFEGGAASSNKTNHSKSQVKQGKNESQRNKREAKKLQKYDSNSIDEEEFQDYFSNPQKRKEFDRQRLNQQRKEIQSIAGFSLGQFGGKSMKSIKDAFPHYPGEDFENTTKDAQQKNYATVSLCCLSVTNPFRNKIIQIVAINNWFDRIILWIIFTNCIFLALDKEFQSVTAIADKADFVFLLIYTIEMILKIIAMGFFMRAHSYLRDPWNVLDFVVVVLGWVSLGLSEQDISAIRVIRILRPLRTINSMPGMSSLVSTILNSLPIMVDIMILFGFMLVMFGTIATQLLGGHLEKRCFALNDEQVLSEKLGDEGKEYFCQSNTDCNSYPECFGQACQCNKFGNPLSGTFNFDNILYSMLNIFQIITLEGWTSMMYMIRDAENSTVFDIFFLMCVLFGSYFVLNLMIAVQFTYLGDAFDEEDRRQREIKEKIMLKKQQKAEQEEDSFFGDDDDDDDEDDQDAAQSNNQAQLSENTHRHINRKPPSSANQAAGARKSGQDNRNLNNDEVENDPESLQENGKQGHGQKKKKKNRLFKCKKNKQCISASNKVEQLVESPAFSRVIIVLILFNTLFLASEHYGQPDWLHRAQDIGNVLFTIVFALEMILKLFGLGIKKYVADNFNVFDGIIVIVSLVELLNEGSENSGFSVLRAFRLLRIFKIIKSWTELRVLLITVLKSLGAITNLGFLTILYLFIMSLLSKQLYGDILYDEDGNESRYTFRTTGYSLITIYIILTGENWNEIMIQVINLNGQLFQVSMFFIFMMIFGHLMLLNLFLAILLKFISENQTSDDDGAVDGENSQQIGDKDDPFTSGGPNDENKLALQKMSKDKKVQIEYQDSGPLNSSNSNIEEEFEQIKMQLQQLSNMNLNQLKNRRATLNQHASGNPANQDYSMDQASEGPNKNGGTHGKFKKEQMLPIDQLQIKTMSNRAVGQSKKKFQKKVIEIDEDSRSLYLFSHDNCLRVFLKTLIENPYFEGYVYHVIALNSLLLALDVPTLEDTYQVKTIQFLGLIISITFILECVIKIIVMGFVIGEKSYLRDNWNRLDFIIVVFGIVSMILENIGNAADIDFIRAFRALRALRPLRMVSKNEGIKTVVNALLHSIPSLLNVLLIIILFLLVFGILGVQLLKGRIGFCNDESENILTKADCTGYFMQPQIKNGELVSNKVEHIWTVPINNFNNLIFSMMTFFEISTLEMWPDIMFNAIDAVGVDMVMKKDNQVAISLIFIIYIFLTTFFIMNLFISVIVDKFIGEIKKRQGAHNFTEEQKEWVKIQRLLVHTNPKIIPVEPINCFRLQCFKIVQSQVFEYVIMAAIIINTGFLCIDYYGKPKVLESVLEIANYTFVSIFTFEMILKITAHGFQYYWHVNWNKFDFIIVILSLVAINEELINSLKINVTCLRIIRVSRLLRMVKTSDSLRGLLKTLYMSLGNILTTAILLLLLLFTFAVAGMSLFGQVSDGDVFDKHVNFKTFYNAIITLWRACTGESWNAIMHECFKEKGWLAVIFWVTFQLLTFFIFMNVFIAVIYENFRDIQASDDENDILSLKKKDIKAFQNTWAKYNPMGELYMRTMKLPDFLRELPPPLGYQGIRIEESKLNKIIFCLNIKDHLGRVYYPEVMWTIFHSIVGINDENVNKCEQISNILKIVKRKYKGLGKKVNLDSLCGNKYYRNELTAIKYIQAMKILTKWKNFKNMKIKHKEQQMMKQIQGGAPAANSTNKQQQDHGPVPAQINKRNSNQNQDKILNNVNHQKRDEDPKKLNVMNQESESVEDTIENKNKRRSQNKNQQKQVDRSSEDQNSQTKGKKNVHPIVKRIERERRDAKQVREEDFKNQRRDHDDDFDDIDQIHRNKANQQSQGRFPQNQRQQYGREKHYEDQQDESYDQEDDQYQEDEMEQDPRNYGDKVDRNDQMNEGARLRNGQRYGGYGVNQNGSPEQEDESEFDMQADQNNQFTERNQFSTRKQNPGSYRHNLIDERQQAEPYDGNNYDMDDSEEGVQNNQAQQDYPRRHNQNRYQNYGGNNQQYEYLGGQQRQSWAARAGSRGRSIGSSQNQFNQYQGTHSYNNRANYRGPQVRSSSSASEQ